MRDHRLACETIASRRVPSSSRDGLSRIRAIYISGQDFETYIARMRDGFSLQCIELDFNACNICTYTINHSWTWCGYSWPRWPSAIYCDHSINCSRQLNSHEKQCDKTDYNNWICFTTTHMMLMPRNVNHSFVCCSFSFLGNINVYKKLESDILKNESK